MVCISFVVMETVAEGEADCWLDVCAVYAGQSSNTEVSIWLRVYIT